MKFLIFITIFIFYYNHATNAIFVARCDLARELQRRGVPVNDIPSFICIAQFESNFNTERINRVNTDGSWSWGIFQISDRWWCNPGDNRPTSNFCGISCNQLITNDIGAAITCARQIQGRQGFTSWSSYNEFCSGGRTVSVRDCGVGN